MIITDTTEITDVTTNSAYKFTITGHAGVTVSLQYEDEKGWHDYLDTSSTADWDGYVDLAGLPLRVFMSAPGSIAVNYEKDQKV